MSRISFRRGLVLARTSWIVGPAASGGDDSEGGSRDPDNEDDEDDSTEGEPAFGMPQLPPSLSRREIKSLWRVVAEERQGPSRNDVDDSLSIIAPSMDGFGFDHTTVVVPIRGFFLWHWEVIVVVENANAAATTGPNVFGLLMLQSPES
jgi:hypothetical protein